MLTKFHAYSSFKKKFTVVTIWIISFIMLATMVYFLLETKIKLLWLVLPIMLGLFIVFGILLRCKIARWFTLLTIYTFALSSFVSSIMLGEFVPLYQAMGYLVLLLISVYVFSNEKAMQLFYIEHNPSEHLPLILLALTMNALFVYFVRIP